MIILTNCISLWEGYIRLPFDWLTGGVRWVMDWVRNFSLEEAVVREVERRKRCISAEEERCLVAQRLFGSFLSLPLWTSFLGL